MVMVMMMIIVIVLTFHNDMECVCECECVCYHEFVSYLVFEPLLCLLQFCVCFEYLYIYELDSGSYFAAADHLPSSSSQALTTTP